MKQASSILKDTIITAAILCISFVLGLIVNLFNTETLIPSVFILGVFLTSLATQGYLCGMISSFISVIAVNFAFTFPYFKINFSMPENVVSAIIMGIIAFLTCGFTTRFKHYELIKAEGEKEKMRANLLRAVSHDLRTPLTAIYGASSALIDNQDNLSGEQKNKMLMGIKEDASWLSRLVENLLSITKLDGGGVNIIKTPTALDELIDSVLVKFKKRFPGQKVEIDIPQELILIPMDAILIEQVLLNLLENAVQHAHGMTQLSLKVFVLGEKVIFEIKDNGCGIAPEKLKQLFHGCYTEEKSLDSRRNNAGIGLSVCATIIKAHGGDIKAENSKDGGCVFRFILEAEEEEGDQQ